MAAKGGRKRPAAEQPKIHQDDVDGIVFQSPREVKNKVTDFAKFVDSLATENEENKKERILALQRLTDANGQIELLNEQIEALKQAGDRQKRIVLEQDETIKNLKTEHSQQKLRIDGFENDTRELTRLRGSVSEITEHLKDYITLESSGASVLTTTGQVSFFHFTTIITFDLIHNRGR